MTRSEFIQEIKNQVEILKAERIEVKKILTSSWSSWNWKDAHKATKLDHEISALENAIRELERI